MYVSMTTFKRDGSPASTPVWIVRSGDSYAVISGDKTWKVRRLSRDPRVEIRVSDGRSRSAPSATVYAGKGEIDSSPEVIHTVRELIAAKYGFRVKLVGIFYAIQRKRGRGDGDSVVIRFAIVPG